MSKNGVYLGVWACVSVIVAGVAFSDPIEVFYVDSAECITLLPCDNDPCAPEFNGNACSVCSDDGQYFMHCLATDPGRKCKQFRDTDKKCGTVLAGACDPTGQCIPFPPGPEPKDCLPWQCEIVTN